jgi:hypothetical protein
MALKPKSREFRKSLRPCIVSKEMAADTVLFLLLFANSLSMTVLCAIDARVHPGMLKH